MKKLTITIITGIILIIHCLTLHLPLWTLDDYYFIDYALNNQLSSWGYLKSIGLGFFLNSYGLWDSWVIHMILLRSFLETFGAGLTQVRAAPFMFHLAALIIIFLSIVRFKVPKMYAVGLFAYLVSSPAFYLTHSARPEGAILFLSAISLYWLLFINDRVISLITGIVMALGLGFHSNMLIIIVSIIGAAILTDRLQSIFSKRFFYWAIGIAIGLIIYIHLFPIDRVIHCFQLQNNRIGVHQLPIIRYGLNLLIQVNNFFSLFIKGLMKGPFYIICHSAYLALALIYWRRFTILSRFHRTILTFSTILFLTLAFLTPHKQFKYLALMYVWVYLITGMCIFDIWKRKIDIDRFDLGIYLSINLFVVSITYNFIYSYLMLFPLTVIGVKIMRISHRTFIKILMVLMALIIFIHIIDPTPLIQSKEIAMTLIYNKPFIFLFIFFMPWLVSINNKTLDFNIVYSHINSRQFILVSFMGFFLMNHIGEVYCVIKSFRQSHVQIHEFKKEIHTASVMKPVLAPIFFHTFNEKLEIQCIFAINHIQMAYPKMNPVSLIYRFNPKTVFWPESEKETLVADLKKFKKWKMTLEFNEDWTTPKGDFTEITFHRS